MWKHFRLIGIAVLIPLIMSGCANTEQKTKQTNTEIQYDSLNDIVPFDKVKQDLTLIFSMYNEETYKEAKNSISYTDNIKEVYFSKDKWDFFTEATGKPQVNVVIEGIELPKQDSKDCEYSYYCKVSIGYPNYSGNMQYKVYGVTMKYKHDGTLDKFERRCFS